MAEAKSPGAAASGGLRGSDQSGMRAYNERLVLSLIRRYGPQGKSEIARLSGLSAQTVSVIMRSLEADRLVAREPPVRGRIGQPMVPMRLDADGALFFGLKIGRRSADLVLIDFLGAVRGRVHRAYRYPDVEEIVAFVAEATEALVADISPALRTRIAGLGVAMPFQLWDWAPDAGLRRAALDPWRTADIRALLADRLGMPVFVQNDTSAACGAELVFGTHPGIEDFLHFYIGYFIGGGVAMHGAVYTGRTGNAGAMGSVPVPGGGGKTVQLIEVASLSVLERMLQAKGLKTNAIWAAPAGWNLDAEVLGAFIAQAASGLAHAIAAATAVIDFEAVLIDGWLPEEIKARLVEATKSALLQIDLAGLTPPRILAGTVGPDARALGAACLPLSERFLVDRNLLTKTVGGH